MEARDEEGEEVQEVRRPIGMDRTKKKAVASTTSSTTDTDEALARLMVSEYAFQNEPYMTTKKHDRIAFLEIKRHELELKQQELSMRKYEQRQKYEIRLKGDESDTIVNEKE
ncbi:hypothetical protein Tco_1463311, partial [Tanacetum coccineum]